MHLINGLHEFLNDDPEFVAAALLADVSITDVRRPKDKKDLELFSGRIFTSPAPASPCSAPTAPSASAPPRPSSSRLSTTAASRPVLVGTGQTTIIQGARYGVALDAHPCPQFCSGEVEDQVVEAFEGEDPDVIVVEGQGALSHPAYLTSTPTSCGAAAPPASSSSTPGAPGPRRLPDDRHAQRRPRDRLDRDVRRHPGHRHHGEPRGHDTTPRDRSAIDAIELDLGIPATDPLTRALDQLADMVLDAFPALEEAPAELR